ncbi:carbohydrate binding domain-containing protein [Paenibacillus sp. CC-CFT747]|nr:carbohydrate binding domain-containing protein [Paenibacillus sp. CC-CFT747]
MTDPVETTIIFNGAVGSENGHDVMYTTAKGSPSVLNVIDLDDYSLLRTLPLPDVSETWSHDVAPNGDVYIASAGGGARLWKYSPGTQTVAVAATFPGESYAWSADIAPDGNVYVGTYPGGKVYKYNPTTSQVYDYGRMIGATSQEYVRSIAYSNGYVYAGTAHDQIVKLDVSTGAKTNIAASLGETGTVYDLNMVDDRYLFARYSDSKNAYVYDTQTGTWSPTVISNVNGLHVAKQSYNGNIYFMADGELKGYNLATQTVQGTGMLYGSGLRGANWATIDDPALPGLSLVTIQYGGGVAFFNMQTNKVVQYPPVVQPLPAINGKVATGPGGKLYTSAMQSSKGGIYDPATGTRTFINLGQAGGMAPLNGLMYFGVYPGAKFQSFNPALPPSDDTNPLDIGVLGSGQDRVHAMIPAEGKIFMGSIADYGQTGGALAVYNPSTNALQTYRNVVQDQSVISLAYKNGRIYGSTSINNGLGSTATASEAKIFVWDTATSTKIKEISINLPGLSNPKFIGGLVFGPDGLLWGGAENFVFALDPESNQVVKSAKLFPDGTLSYGVWGGIEMHASDDQFLYAMMDERLVVLDPYTMHSKFLADAYSFDIGSDGHLYYISSTDRTKLYRIKVQNQVPYAPGLQTVNLLNSDFELPVNAGVIPGWSATAGTTYAVTNEKSQSGAYSLKITDTSSTGSVALQTDAVKVVAGEYYNARTSVYLVSGQASFLIRYYDGNGSDVGSEERHITGGAGQWQEVNLYSVAPAAAKTARLFAFSTSYAQATAYYDAVTLLGPPETYLTVTNAGFETADASGNPTGWTSAFATSASGYYELSTLRKTGGTRSLKITDTNPSGSVALYSSPIPVRPWAEYTARAKMWIESGTASLMLRFYDSSGAQIAEQPIHVNTQYGQWQTVEAKLAAPSAAATAKIYAYTTSASQSVVYYDDITFSAYADSPVTVANPGMETAGSPIANWTMTTPVNSGVSYEQSGAISYKGTKSLKLKDTSTSAAITLVSDPASAVAGMSYTARTKVYLVQGQASLYFRFYNASGTEIGSQSIHVTGNLNQWQDVELTATAPAGTTSSRLVATTTTGATAEAYYDEFMIYWNVY